MTRLSGMPYDGDDARHELALLESELRKLLVEKLSAAKKAKVDRNRLNAFARFVLESEASIVTFNYDDVLDQSLLAASPTTSGFRAPPKSWEPNGGYGLFCRPSGSCVADSMAFMERPSTLLLKLHGSVNWYVRLGERTPFGPANLLHHEEWSPQSNLPHDLNQIRSHLERDPFIVPPVLVKSELSLHPVLRVIWELAHDKLTNATEVVFIGYSIPETDMAARILFRETLSRRTGYSVRVVSLASETNDEELLKNTYRSLFKDLADDQFDFSGARRVIEREFSEPLANLPDEGTV
jgi:hypothetical protein